jgi:hypothetical protein
MVKFALTFCLSRPIKLENLTTYIKNNKKKIGTPIDRYFAILQQHIKQNSKQ